MTATDTGKTEWQVYIVEADDGKLYTGITTDVERRFNEHATGKKGARFFRTTSPARIVFREKHPDRSSATKREMAIKKMTRQQKLDLVNATALQPLDLCIPLHNNPAYRYWREKCQSSHWLHLVGLNKNNIKFK